MVPTSPSHLRYWRRAGLIVGLVMACPGAVAAQSGRWVDAWRSHTGRLVVNIAYATIRVSGHDVDSVRIEIEAPASGFVALPLPRRVGDEVRLEAPGNQIPVGLAIRVPRRFRLDLRGSNGGPIQVDGVHGPMVIENSNAAIRVTGVREAILAATSNGPIVATFDIVLAARLLSLITSNDSISVALPAGADADVFLQTDNGRITSDFSIDALPGSQKWAEAPTETRALRGVIGGGGSTLRIRTDNGDIHLRRGSSRRTAPQPSRPR